MRKDAERRCSTKDTSSPDPDPKVVIFVEQFSTVRIASLVVFTVAEVFGP